MLKWIAKSSFLVSGVASLMAWLRWRQLRHNRIPAPRAESLIRNPDPDIFLRREDDTLYAGWSEKFTVAELYLYPVTEESQKSAIVIVENQKHLMLADVENVRYQLELVLDEGHVVKHMERIIPLESVENLRDIGGYITQDNRRVRWNGVYRSSALSRLSVEDSRWLESAEVTMVCDIRTVEEHLFAPDKLPATIEVLTLHPISHDNRWLVLFQLLFQDGFIESVLADIYQRVMIDENPRIFKAIFERLADESNLPLLIHCAVGKDRTGISIALLLAFLGVADETIIADYTLSNQYYEFFKNATRKTLEQLKIAGLTEQDFDYLLIADGDMMQDTLTYIRENYGSIEGYLIHHAGISPDTLQAVRNNLLD